MMKKLSKLLIALIIGNSAMVATSALAQPGTQSQQQQQQYQQQAQQRQEQIRQQQAQYQQQIQQTRQQEQARQQQIQQQQAQKAQPVYQIQPYPPVNQTQLLAGPGSTAQMSNEMRQQQAAQAQRIAEQQRQDKIRQQQAEYQQQVAQMRQKEALRQAQLVEQQRTEQQRLEQLRQQQAQQNKAAAIQSEANTWQQMKVARANGDEARVKSLISTLPQSSRGSAMDAMYGGATEIDVTPYLGVGGLAKGAVVAVGKTVTKTVIEDVVAYEAKKAAQAAARAAEKNIAKDAIPSTNITQKINVPGNAGTYQPQRALPRDSYGNPIPDANTAHTQIGVRNGRNGNYTQARTWDNSADGNITPKKTIDFTDHGRPATHTNPHQHEFIQNPTGGTMQRATGKPLNN